MEKTVKIRGELAELLEAEAKKKNRNFSNMVETILLEHFKKG